jgi:hypothetical protein
MERKDHDKVRVTFRQAVYRQHFVLTTNPLRFTASNCFKLNTCEYSPYVTSFLMRGWAWCLKLLLGLASTVILMSVSRGIHEHILLSQIGDSHNLEGQAPYLYTPGRAWPGYTPLHWVSFLSPPTTRRVTVDVFDPASTRDSQMTVV